ncbi:protein-glutamate O-methyltransferase CheR [Lysobacter sp. CFH 32150]|uniref:CheR family methyltransferase n=1 Tax=Lysobacter sp. CFH 32150 TaxID=2927128 RepID=UPI001FA791E0|nr:protein-glutamate O-methyltransferase CheR [Lysobacter sp. CFH 32150]MCI4566630.1 methyltransferase domain-containing protein [Lysobacter sp. CFH 32150]
MMTLPDSHEVARFRALVADRLGLHIDESRLGSLAEVLRSRVAVNGGACAAYLNRLADDRCPTEDLQALARELTVTETFFFRGADQLAAFTESALPDRLAAVGEGGIVRVLSAGCASGDEPYSLAIAVREALPYAADRVAITAFDLNQTMLEKAARGRYSSWSLRDAAANLQARWFTPEGSAFALDDAIHRAVAFHQRNLAQDDPDFWRPGQFDIVFCRNVLMYFTASQAQAAVARIARALAPGGYLFLGHAETLRGLSNDFHLCHTHDTFYYQRKEGVSATREAASQRVELWQPAAAINDTSWVDIIQRSADRIHELVPAPAPATATSVSAATRHAPDLNRVLEHLHRDQFDQALEQLDTLPAAQARDPDVLLLKAVSLSHSAALDKAEAVCREVLECDELNAGAHYVLALCREGAGDAQGAFEHDQVAVYLDPAFAMPRLHLGLLARRRGDPETAQRELQQAIALLQREDPARLLLFGGGFQREALIALCRAECAASAEHSSRRSIRC